MKLSPLCQIKLAAVLTAAATLLGCEAPESSAGEQAPAIYPTAAAPPAGPSLVTVSNAAPTPPIAPEGLQPVSAERPAEPVPAGEPRPAPVKLSDRLQEVVKLAQSGVGDDVILAFIQNSTVPFSPTPEEIVYLTDLGLSDVIITALVNHLGSPAVVANPPAQGPVNPGTGPGPMGPPNGQPPGAGVATYNPEPQVVYSSPPVVQYVEPQPEVQYNYFYNSLSPYGSWVQVSDYGWCWQPTVAVVQRDWRPYGDRGCWLSTDSGWYWQSDYSWGWAPFHYGRWFNHPGRGWCWRPDSVWAPAWVSWRYTDSHCGWAPLPPGAHFHEHSGFTYYGAHVGVSFGFGLHTDAWTFVPAGHLHDREVWRHRVPPGEHRALYHNSRVVNNYVVNNHTIVNRGVTREHVPALPRAEVRKIAVRDVPERGGTAFRPDRSRPGGAEVVAYRPRAVEAAQPQNSRGPASSGGRAVASQSGDVGRGGGSAVNNIAPAPAVDPARGGQGRSRVEAPAVDAAGTRPNRGVGTAPGGAVQRALDERPSQAAAPAPSTRPGTSLDTLRPIPQNRPAPSTVTPGQSGAPQNSGRSPTASSIAPRIEPSRTPNVQAPAVQAPASVAPRAQPQLAPAARQEVPKTTVNAPERPAPALPTYRAREAASTPQQLEPAAAARPPSPNTYSPPVQSRPAQATPSYSPPVQSRPTPSYSAPVQSRPAQVAPSYSPPVQSRPIPSYSAPVQSRPSQPAPSYAPPVQSRPVPSYSAPAQSRPAQTAPATPAPARPAPAQNQDRSSNRRQF